MRNPVYDVLADVASGLADKIKECIPCYFPVLAADPSGYHLALKHLRNQLFPELRPHPETAFEQAAEGSTHVINRYRGANTNLHTQLMRIIERAGLEPWPKLFSEFALDAGNGTSGTIPDSRRLFVDWQQQSCRHKTLSSDNRRALQKSDAKSDADGA